MSPAAAPAEKPAPTPLPPVDLAAARARYRHLSDAQILDLAAGHGPAVVGRELHGLAASIRASSGGTFGPAVTDPHYAEKEAAKRAKARAAAVSDESDEDGDGDGDGDETTEHPVATPNAEPFAHLSLSGLKSLAIAKGVSYPPRVKKPELLARLQAAGVALPPPPDPATLVDDDDDEVRE